MKLNLGCGFDIRKGYVNLDCYKHSGVDVVHNINRFPYPFENNAFDEILCNDVLIYAIDIIKVMEELHRISKNNGIIIIRDIAYTNVGQYTQPEPIRVFSVDSFQWLDTNDKNKLKFKRTNKKFSIEKKSYIRSKYFRWLPQKICDFLSWFINSLNSRVLFKIRIIK